MPRPRSGRQSPHVAVVTDSTAALPPGAADRWGLQVVPLQVLVDGVLLEGVDLTASTVEALQRGARVTTLGTRGTIVPPEGRTFAAR